MRLKNILLFIYLCISSSFIKAQTFKLEENSFNYKTFPEITFKFHTRSIANIDSSAFILKENNIKITDITFQQDINEIGKSKNKTLFILIENHYLNKGINERIFFKNILSTALHGRIAPGDKIFIGTFDWYRNGKYVFLAQNASSDDENTIVNLINNITPQPNLTNKQIGADIYFALDETLKFLTQIKDSLPKNILLLSDDFPNVAGQKTVLEITNESIKSDIPIYAIGYNVGALRYSQVTKNEICALTNGAYFTNDLNDENLNAQKVGEFLDNMNQKSLGRSYVGTYVTNQKKLGQQVTVQIGSNEKNMAESKAFYPFNLLEWIKANILIFIGILLFLLLLSFLIFKLIKRRRLEKIELLVSQQDKELQLNNTADEIERLKFQQVLNEQKLKDQKLLFEEETKLEKLTKLMKAKGVNPRVTYDFNDQKGQFYIDSPKFTLGRDEHSNSFHMGVSSISRNHASINFSEDGKFTIQDLNSTNGVIVNGDKVLKIILKNADIIKLGDVTLKINL